LSGHDEEYERSAEPRMLGLFEGVVVDVDPRMKRIKVQIPGVVEPESEWAFPVGAGSNGTGVGMFGTPRRGAMVNVMFLHGRVDQPRYWPGHWIEADIPDDAKNREFATIWSSETFQILLDETAGERRLRIVNRKFRPVGEEEYIEFNAEDNSITISAATAVNIRAIGEVEIDAAQIVLNGRKVLPTSDPI